MKRNEKKLMLAGVHMVIYTITDWMGLIPISSSYRFIYWAMFGALVLLGLVKLSLFKFRPEKSYKFTIDISIGLSIMLVLFLALTRETYAIIVAFLLLVTKGALLLYM